MTNKKILIGIFGLGYVGLPLAIEFGKKFNVIGYDYNSLRISQLKNKNDTNNDIYKKDFIKAKFLKFTDNYNSLLNCNTYIITVPTPIDKKKNPNLKFIREACNIVGGLISLNDTIIFESTVYPGLTEEFCVPIIEKKSKLIFNKDFFCGYSPERINPNDKIHNITNIIKVTSGSNKKTAFFIDNLYKSIVKAGTYRAPSIKIAEAAKVIENTQRDLNIAFVNELTLIFDKLKIDTDQVLKAASTKWNFINFKPGLVGGHCIGVDPYYLTYRSKLAGYNPKIITAGREVNDKFVNYVILKSEREISKIFKKKKYKYLILGLTFKENCSDFRNSKSIEIVKKLKKRKHLVHCFDPLIQKKDFIKKYNLKLITKFQSNFYDCIIISVAHKEFSKFRKNKLNKYLNSNGKIFDIKRVLPFSENNIYL